jgi:hypothetical protein
MRQRSFSCPLVVFLRAKGAQDHATHPIRQRLRHGRVTARARRTSASRHPMVVRRSRALDSPGRRERIAIAGAPARLTQGDLLIHRERRLAPASAHRADPCAWRQQGRAASGLHSRGRGNRCPTDDAARPEKHRREPGCAGRRQRKAVQRMLGHASAAMTLDVYAGLFGDDLDAVADRLDEAAAKTSCGLFADSRRRIGHSAD